MRTFDDFLRALDKANLADLTHLLLLYTHHRHGPDRAVLVLRAMDEAMRGQHKHLLKPGLSLPAYLALVIDAIA